MLYRLLADLLLLIHAAFIAFAVLGGLLVLYRRWWAWLHIPAAVWAAAVVIMGWICPLTPWEQQLRLAAGQRGLSGGFIEHYLMSVIYPDGLTRSIQIGLGVSVVVFNLLVYALMWRFLRRASTKNRLLKYSAKTHL